MSISNVLQCFGYIYWGIDTGGETLEPATTICDRNSIEVNNIGRH